jgi:hypothetical protein
MMCLAFPSKVEASTQCRHLELHFPSDRVAFKTLEELQLKVLTEFPGNIDL